MWRITWRCFNHEDGNHSEVQEVGRSPYSGAVDTMTCTLCGKPMRLSAAEDLRPKVRQVAKVRRRPGGFKAEQGNLF